MFGSFLKMKTLVTLLAFSLTLVTARAEHEGKIQILLLGDSSTEASVPKWVAKKEPQFEEVIRLLLAGESDLLPTNVVNFGQGGDYIRELLDTGRYEKLASKLPGLDYIFMRYGLNDLAYRKNFETDFPKDFHELLAPRLVCRPSPEHRRLQPHRRRDSKVSRADHARTTGEEVVSAPPDSSNPP
jgi:lysophospholipase L1-like esterase